MQDQKQRPNIEHLHRQQPRTADKTLRSSSSTGCYAPHFQLDGLKADIARAYLNMGAGTVQLASLAMTIRP